eukprot:2770585-Rhodomonas_salina.2
MSVSGGANEPSGHAIRPSKGGSCKTWYESHSSPGRGPDAVTASQQEQPHDGYDADMRKKGQPRAPASMAQ